MTYHRSSLAFAMAIVVFTALAGLLASGCRQETTPASPPAAAVSPSAQMPDATPDDAAEPSPTVLPMPSSGITLTWWTPEFFSPLAGGASGEVVAEQVAGFVAMNPDMGVQPILKAAEGRGGILDFLRTASAAAPSVVPDVVTISTSDLPAAVQNQLLQPLDDLLSAELRDDLFPFAASVGEFDRQWYAVQFAADLQHLVYRRDDVRRVPQTWDEVLSGRASYMFPAGGREGLVNDASLIQYLGAGGVFDMVQGIVTLEEEPLLAMLTFYRRGTERRLIPYEVLVLDDLEACWNGYVTGDADMTHVLASRYLQERRSLPDSSFAAIPTRSGEPVTIGQGWALAIATREPEQQRAAVQFVEWLLDPTNNAAWTMAARRLPARRSALAAWDGDDEYVEFLTGQLEAATFRPSGAGYVEIARLMHQAVRDVLTGVASPEEAAAAAVQALGS